MLGFLDSFVLLKVLCMKDLNGFNIFIILLFFFIFLIYLYKKFNQRLELQVFREVYKINEGLISLPNEKMLILRYSINFLVFIFLSISLFNPSFQSEENPEDKIVSGVDIVFLVDVSLSMNSIDTLPTRLDKFKESILKILPNLNGNRLGIIAFANTTFLYCPMTSDISAFTDYIKGMDVNMIPNAGTNIAKALTKADEILKSSKIKRNKILVIVTDGEDMKGGFGSKVDAEVLIWGVGSEEGGFILYKNQQSNQTGYITKTGQLTNNLSDPELIKTSLDKDFLLALASKNSGEYFNLTTNPLASDSLLNKISGMQKNTLSDTSRYSKKDGYQYFLIFGILLLLIDLFLVEFFLFKKTHNG
jgi:Ca-activated chloride channel homolog